MLHATDVARVMAPDAAIEGRPKPSIRRCTRPANAFRPKFHRRGIQIRRK
jgi:hypothetical protein